MKTNTLCIRQSIVFVSAVVYWGGVMIHARRIHKHIGRSPNIKPAGLKENLLWLGWFLVIAGWIGQALIISRHAESIIFFLPTSILRPSGIFIGLLIALGGYAGTLWCYSVIGDSWRIGINKSERTALVKDGPYCLIRHPIYIFQMMILIGMMILLPTLLSLLILLVHIVCVIIKAFDEERHLERIYEVEYHDYFDRTGRFFPKFNSLKHFFRGN